MHYAKRCDFCAPKRLAIRKKNRREKVMSIPEVKKDEKGIATLYVHEKPFFSRAGEIHNSSASDPEYMKKEVWPKLRGMHMNSVIVPIYWELLEPEEGKYDFSSVNSLIMQAREEGMKLVFLWFGLWKNAESMYVPGWMKQDTGRYWHVQKVNGEALNIISPMCDEAVEKDRKAFYAVMSHVKEIDEAENTVIAIQVENEIGVLGAERDYSPMAQKAFEDEIPSEMAELFQKNGSWKNAFGENAEEYFMAYFYAKAVEKIASSGKSAYPLPLYANAWLEQYPWYKGSYPTGGPVKSVHKIWKALAPSLFTLAPDIYVSYCADVMDEYAYDDNPLFIPEIRKDAVAASYCLYAFLAKNAICFSPFGVEDLALDPATIEKPPMDVMMALNIDPTALDTTGSREKLAAAYELMENLEPLYLKHRGTGHLKAYVRHGENDFGTVIRLEDYDLAVAYSPRMSAHPLGSIAVFELEKNKLLVIGTECSVKVRVKPGEKKHADFLRMEEGNIVNGEWKPGRVMNGDEKMSVKFGSMPGMYLL